MYRDPESTIQDGDFEIAELEQAAERARAMRRAGKCDHGWTGPKEDGKPGGEFTCYHCHKTWPSWEARDLECFGYVSRPA